MKSREDIDAAIECSTKLEFSNLSQAISCAGSLKFASISDEDIPKSLLILTVRLQKKSFLKNVVGQQDLHHTRTVRYIDFHSFTGTGIFFEQQEDTSREKSEAFDDDLADAAGGSDGSQETVDKGTDELQQIDQHLFNKNLLEVAHRGPLLREKEETGLQMKQSTAKSIESKVERLQTENDSVAQHLQSPLKMLRR